MTDVTVEPVEVVDPFKIPEVPSSKRPADALEEGEEETPVAPAAGSPDAKKSKTTDESSEVEVIPVELEEEEDEAAVDQEGSTAPVPEVDLEAENE